MSRQKMITVAAEDVQELVVGSLAEYHDKLVRATHPEQAKALDRIPMTFQKMFRLPEKVTMRVALGV